MTRHTALRAATPTDPEFTHGPWECVPATEHHGFYVTNAYGGTVCDLYTMSKPDMLSRRNGGESEPIGFMGPLDGPNANLIAAAPSMFDALAQIKHSIGQARVPGNDWKRELALIENLASEALAKARGEVR